MKNPKIDLNYIKKQKSKDFKERLEFVKRYAEWVKKTPNKIWSAQQKELIG